MSHLKMQEENNERIFLYSTLTVSKELSILLLKLYNNRAIDISASFSGPRIRNLD